MLTFRNAILSCLVLVAAGLPSSLLSASEAEQISSYRTSHGLGRVTRDATLDRIAQTQASAMAARDVLDHNVVGSFSSRMASSSSGRAAENIAYGHASFPKTLDQWIRSSGHRKNLLMRGASRVGVASATSAKTGRTYWAMVIAGDYERPKRIVSRAVPTMTRTAEKPARPTAKPKGKERAQPCRMKFLGLCF